MQPLVSVVIINRNGREFVDACLRSVFSSDYPEYEVIFVDNASDDGSLEYVKDNFRNNLRLAFVENKESVGPAVGRNRGVRAAQGKYILFLDNDTQIDKICIRELVAVLENDGSVGEAQAKLLKLGADNIYDCAGDYLGPLGFLIERSRGVKDVGQFDYIADILSAKSAGCIIRRDVFDKIGGFDEDFYMYLEETDLSWRVWLAGYRVVFIPQAVVYHAFNTPRKVFKKYYSKYIVRYYGCRNYISTLIKNLEFVNLIRFLPLQMGCLFVLSFLFSLKGDLQDGFYVFKAIGWNVLNLPVLFRKKRIINQRIRVTDDKKILDRVMDRKSVQYYFGKAFSYVTGKSF